MCMFKAMRPPDGQHKKEEGKEITLNNVGWTVVQCLVWLGDRMTLNQTKTGEEEEEEED